MLAGLLASCHHIDDNRIPSHSVMIDLTMQGNWNLYGAIAYGDYCYFIRGGGAMATNYFYSSINPSITSFPFTANTYTGFAGVLLVSGYSFEYNEYNFPLAYDLCCPVEMRNDTRVKIDTSNFEAVCESCGSHYNVLEGAGQAVSGRAYHSGYGLRRYTVDVVRSGAGSIIGCRVRN